MSHKSHGHMLSHYDDRCQVIIWITN